MRPPTVYSDAEVQVDPVQQSPMRSTINDRKTEYDRTISNERKGSYDRTISNDKHEQVLSKSESKKSIQSKHSHKASPLKETFKAMMPAYNRSEAAVVIQRNFRASQAREQYRLF